MIKLKRYSKNPILVPRKDVPWEKEATFNGCVVKNEDKFHILYRAESEVTAFEGMERKQSTIGYGLGIDGVNFGSRRQLVVPEHNWEKYGCEDPRVTKIGGKYYIFYTALSTYPFSPPGIKIGLAITSDFNKIEEKHQVTYFNSKAMALFPEKINGKLAAVLTVHTDMPPPRIALAQFERKEDIYSKEYWQKWYSSLNSYDIHLLRSTQDHLEIGAPPIKTKKGWLVIYSYIRAYQTSNREFGIEAVLLDLINPFKIIGRTNTPLLTPEKDYEKQGNVPNVVFPSGAQVIDGRLYIYYGAADTTCCLASCNLEELLEEVIGERKKATIQTRHGKVRLKRFKGNPIITPIPEHKWESRATFNPAAIYLDDWVHLLYRAMSEDDTSVLGYASSRDGFHIEERLESPVYVPRGNFEIKANRGNSGCEDPRITKLGNRLYMTYTGYNAIDHTRVALTSIQVNDFLNKNWNFKEPVILSLPSRDDKNSCVLEKKYFGRYVVFHRIFHNIWIDFLDTLEPYQERKLMGTDWIRRRVNKWDSEKIGIAGPPVKTDSGWLLIYHGLSSYDLKYRLGALLLNKDNPAQVISRLDYPILEPEADYENSGIRPGTVFACGNVVIDGKLFVYYGGADQVVCLATVFLEELLAELKRYAR